MIEHMPVIPGDMTANSDQSPESRRSKLPACIPRPAAFQNAFWARRGRNCCKPVFSKSTADESYSRSEIFK